MSDLFLLAGAGLLAGAMNAMAGGGSFLSFPAILSMGILPVQANATNTVALWPGQVTSLATLKSDVRKDLVPVVVMASVFGGLTGAEVLLHTRQITFLHLIPWLLLTGAVIFGISGPVSRWLRARSAHPHAERRPRYLLLLSLVTNLGLLAFFKYANWLIENWNLASGAAGFALQLTPMDIVLPVGISFYTFQSLSYTIDVYRRDHPPAHSFLDFALYVSYFPHLVAGPIQRYMLLDQIQWPRRTTWEQIASGSVLILIGLVRKVAIADSIAPHVDRAFSQPLALGSLDLLFGLYLFSIQIYCDFAGYTDIARVSSRLLGIEPF